MHALFIDNYDSFIYNLVDAFARLGAEVDVCRNDIGVERALALAGRKRTSLIVLSPGPGTPRDAGCTIDLIRAAAGRIPLFGVCLGHQAIAEAFGGRVGFAGEIVHGKKSIVRHSGHVMFRGLPETFEAARYHSLAANELPKEIDPVAAADGVVMALAHRSMPIYGVQFHPESVLTTYGQRILENVLQLGLNRIDAVV